MTTIDILTLFPEMFNGPFASGVVGRAQKSGLVTINLHNIRDFAYDRHRSVDDYPYGGGPGMVMKPEPIFRAVEELFGEGNIACSNASIILLSARGRLFNQQIARELARVERLVLICGHYEGVDERVARHLATDEISIGDYILTGGEIAAMVVTDAVLRLVPGVLGGAESAREESYSDGLLEYPQYTRPPRFRGWEVPSVLLSGNHAEIARWRRRESIRKTLERRPDLLEKKGWGGKVLNYGERLDE